MYKLLMDSNALIKISKAEFLDLAAECFNVVITAEVNHECVIEGKKGLHPDAYKIEEIVKTGKIKVLEIKHYKKSKKPQGNFGPGEISVFQASKKDTIIVTDDLSFTSYIQKEKISSISPAHLIYVLLKKKNINVKKAYSYLEKLRPFIRDEIYELVKKEIRGG